MVSDGSMGSPSAHIRSFQLSHSHVQMPPIESFRDVTAYYSVGHEAAP